MMGIVQDKLMNFNIQLTATQSQWPTRQKLRPSNKRRYNCIASLRFSIAFIFLMQGVAIQGFS
nr:hypothetical protein [uncultured Desulfobacter sp.]